MADDEARMSFDLQIPKKGNPIKFIRPPAEFPDAMLIQTWEYALDTMADRESIQVLEDEMYRRGLLGNRSK